MATISKRERARIQYERMTYVRESLEGLHEASRAMLDNEHTPPDARATAEADFRYADGAIAMLDKWRLVLKKTMTQ
jgi:hypothetical protein